jgi:hypothetical protein
VFHRACIACIECDALLDQSTCRKIAAELRCPKHVHLPPHLYYCAVCRDEIPPLDAVWAAGKRFHPACFRCHRPDCAREPASDVAVWKGGKLWCRDCLSVPLPAPLDMLPDNKFAALLGIPLPPGSPTAFGSSAPGRVTDSTPAAVPPPPRPRDSSGSSGARMLFELDTSPCSSHASFSSSLTSPVIVSQTGLLTPGHSWSRVGSAAEKSAPRPASPPCERSAGPEHALQTSPASKLPQQTQSSPQGAAVPSSASQSLPTPAMPLRSRWVPAQVKRAIERACALLVVFTWRMLRLSRLMFVCRVMAARGSSARPHRRRPAGWPS